MKIQWLAHSSFLITSRNGVRILTDPYNTGHGIAHTPIDESAEIVTMSHDHFDHNAFAQVRGNPEKVSSPGSNILRGIGFKGIPVYHDENKGKQRGRNIIFCFTIDGIRLCHLGDLGHTLSAEEVKEIGQVDVLFVPVGGYYTIDAAAASRVCESLKPRIVFPMHFKTAKLDFPVTGVEPFIEGKKNVVRRESSEVEFSTETVPDETEIIVLQPAH